MNYRLPVVTSLLVASLLGCESRTAKQADQPVAAPPARVAAPQPMAPAFTGYHRYRGTVGGLPVTVELTIGPGYSHDSLACEGRYYYERRGGDLQLQAPRPYRPGTPLTLLETANPDAPVPTGCWQAVQPAGPTLRGTWTSASGKTRPFALREDYAGAVRYEIIHETRDGGPCPPLEGGSTAHHREVSHDYLHLLGPDTLQPALRNLQCPPPAKRKEDLADELAETDCESELYGRYSFTEVTLNGYGLLALLVTDDEDTGGAHPNGVNTPAVFDLATGRACAVKNWLRADNSLAMRRLLTHHLLTDSIGQHLLPMLGTPGLDQPPYLVPELPAFGLSSSGIFCTLGDFGAPHVVQRAPITIPYAELVPFLRPGTPLAALVQARQRHSQR